MELIVQDTFLVLVGVGGILISILHGSIGHRKILSQIEGLSAPLKNVNYAVFQLSTLYWLVAGIGLALAPTQFIGPQREAIALVCAFTYITGAIGNFWATRGRHFGWLLLTLVSALAILGAYSG